MKTIIKLIIALGLFFGGVGFASAANRDVCSTCTYTNINSAITAAVSGDTIRVAAGTYTGYQNTVNLSNTNMIITFQGGYNDTFTSRSGETILDDTAFQISPFFSGSVSIDKFTITNQSGIAIYFASSSANLSVTNCHIYHNDGSAILVFPYYPDYNQHISATFNFSNNIIHGSGPSGSYIYGEIDISLNSPDPYISTVTIADNIIYDAPGPYNSGIRIMASGNHDIYSITRNEIYGTKTGISFDLFSGTSAQVDISKNKIHDNSWIGIRMSGSPTSGNPVLMHHNLVYSNYIWGIYHYNPRTSNYYNNTIANNERGIQLIYPSGSPTIENNIFYNNNYKGLFISGSEGGGGGTSMVPASMRYNDFFGGKILNTGLAPAYSYNSEIPGDWNNYNQWSWAEGNFTIDPHFIDPDNGDFTLASDSFCIDQGKPSDTYTNEPAPNGGRINLGSSGNTLQAETTATPVALSNFVAAQNGNQIDFSFDSTTSISAVWLKVEYWDGSAYQQINPSSLSGDDYQLGYFGGRITSGNDKTLSWLNAQSLLAGRAGQDIKLRLTAFHGAESFVIESPIFRVDYQAPSITITSPTASSYLPAAGNLIAASVTDAGAGIASVLFRYKEEGAASYIDLNTDYSAPFVGSLSGVTLIPGTRYSLQAIATNTNGFSGSSSEIVVNVCGFNLSTYSNSFDYNSQTWSLGISANDSSCTRTAYSNADWINIVSGSSASGAGYIEYLLSENTSFLSRSGKITVQGNDLIITQSGKAVPTTTTTSTTTTTITTTSTTTTTLPTVEPTPPPAPIPLLSPNLISSVESLNFNTKEGSKNIEIINRSRSSLIIKSMKLFGSNVFKAESQKFPLTIKAGKSKKFSISFKPKKKEKGNFSGNIIIITTDPNRQSIEVFLSARK